MPKYQLIPELPAKPLHNYIRFDSRHPAFLLNFILHTNYLIYLYPISISFKFAVVISEQELCPFEQKRTPRLNSRSSFHPCTCVCSARRIDYFRYERYGMSNKNPNAITISPSKTPSACIGPKYGICGYVCDPIPNTSAMPEKTAIT